MRRTHDPHDVRATWTSIDEAYVSFGEGNAVMVIWTQCILLRHHCEGQIVICETWMNNDSKFLLNLNVMEKNVLAMNLPSTCASKYSMNFFWGSKLHLNFGHAGVLS